MMTIVLNLIISYADRTPDPKPESCQSLWNAGKRSSGTYSIWIGGIKQVKVYCDMETDGGGWTVIQRRKDATTDFYRGWQDYQKGFGDKRKNFWLGLDTIHTLTSKGVMLIVDLIDLNGKKAFAKYSRFKVGDERSGYKLEVSGYFGNAGDSLRHHNNMKFTTKDKDNDIWNGNCAVFRHGGWWYSNCAFTNLNGLFTTGGGGNLEMISWRGLSNRVGTVIFSEMKLRSQK